MDDTDRFDTMKGSWSNFKIDGGWESSFEQSFKNYSLNKRTTHETVKMAKESEVARTAPKIRRFSKWATPEDIRKTFDSFDLNSNQIYGSGGVPMLYEDSKGYVDNSDNHTMIVGSTGSMKSRRVIAPTINNLCRFGESMIVTDPKQELLNWSHQQLKSNGYKIKVLNLRNPEKGDRWNPLLIPASMIMSGDPNSENIGLRMIRDLCFNMVIEDEKDPYWSIATRGLMYGLICQLIKEVDDIKAVTFENVVALKNRIFKSDESRERFTQSFKMDDPIFVSMSASLVNADNTRRCILSYFDSTILDFVSLPSISDMLSENEFDMDTIGFEKTAIFLIVPDEVESMNCLASAFISEAYHTLIMKAQEKEEHRLPIRVNFILDEFCNIPRIDAMSNIITASRSRNIRFMLAIQSHNQLIATYGDKADTIMSNCLSIVYLYTRDYGFLSYLSNIVGEDENGRSLITPSALMRLNKNKGEALILCERMDPFISNLLDINELLTGNEIQPYVPEPKSPVIRYSITGRKKGNANRRIKKEPKPNWDDDPFAF